MKKSGDETCQLLVIGGGSGGLAAAEVAAKLGADVVLAEAQPELGGECLHSGCVPSKALIHAARTAWTARHSQTLGVPTGGGAVDFRQVMRGVRQAIATIAANHDNDDYYQKLGVKIMHGPAEFIDAHTVQIGDQRVRARRIIIATGSRPFVPDVPGLQSGEFLTNETIFALTELPESLAVIGGGPIGCELGQAMAMLGAKVSIIQTGSRLLPHDELEAADLLAKSLHDMGVAVHRNATIEHITYAKTGDVTVKLKAGHSLHAAQLLVATGRQATLPLGLDKAGVRITPRGITVSTRLQTNRRHIYAIGDCNGGLQFTHAAARQAVIAVQNALLGLRRSFVPTQIPWTTFTTPEIAHYGIDKAAASKQPETYRIIRADFADIDKAVAENQSGFIELIADKKSRVVGATVVGAGAAELLAQILAAKNLKTLSSTVQAYPTYAGGLAQAVAVANLDQLQTQPLGKLLKTYLKFRH